MDINNDSTIDLTALIAEYKSILGPDYSSMMISDKWLPDHDPEHYFLLSCTMQSMKLLERQHNSKNEYELNFSNGSIKVNGEEKGNSFVLAFLEKLKKIDQRIASEEAQVYFKKKDQ